MFYMHEVVTSAVEIGCNSERKIRSKLSAASVDEIRRATVSTGVHEMTFDELWEQVCSTSNLPEGARRHLPTSLSDRTKEIILEKKLSADELAGLVHEAISKINAGSIESIDDLVMKSLEKRRL